MINNDTEILCDPRWTIKDKLVQLRGVVKVHEQSRKWIEGELMEKEAKEKQEMERLLDQTKKMREVLSDYRDGDPEEIAAVLQLDHEVALTCKNLNKEDMIESVKQLVFSRRKELDRLKLELEKKEEHYYEMKKSIELLKESSEERTEPSTPFLRTQEVSTKIQAVIQQQEAAAIVKHSYDKMKRILIKDARCFDSVMASVKEDTEIQCQSIVKALEMGQQATEDEYALKQEYMAELKKVKVKFDNQIKQIKELKREIRRIVESQNLEPPSPPNPWLKTDIDLEEYMKKLEVEEEIHSETIEKLRKAMMTSVSSEVHFRCEGTLRHMCRNYREVVKNRIARDRELLLNEHLERRLEDSINNEPFCFKKLLSEMNKINKSKERQENTKIRIKEALEEEENAMFKMLTIIMNLYNLVSEVGLEQNMTTIAEVVKEELGQREHLAGVDKLPGEPIDEFPLVAFNNKNTIKVHFDDDECHSGADKKDGEDKMEETIPMAKCNDTAYDADLDVRNMLDIIEFKVNMMLKQIGNDFIKKNEIRGTLEELIEYNAQNEDYEEEEVEETGADEELELGERKVLSRLEIKAMNYKFAEEHKEKPPDTIHEEKIIVTKHDCY